MLHMAAKFPEQAGPGPPGHATVCWCTVVIASITVSDCFRSFFFYFQSLDCKMLIGSLASLDARGCWQFCGENPEAYVNVVNAEIL